MAVVKVQKQDDVLCMVCLRKFLVPIRRGIILTTEHCTIPRTKLILYNHLIAAPSSTSTPYTVVIILRKRNQTDPCMYNIHCNEQIYTIYAVTELCSERAFADITLMVQLTINMEISKKLHRI